MGTRGPDGPWVDYDLGEFVCTGAKLDAELLATDPAASPAQRTGPVPVSPSSKTCVWGVEVPRQMARATMTTATSAAP